MMTYSAHCKHVKKDIDAGAVPVHIHIEVGITKGKHSKYDTFIGTETVKYLKKYLEMRLHN